MYKVRAAGYVFISLGLLLSVPSLQKRNLKRNFHRLNSTELSGINCVTFH